MRIVIASDQYPPSIGGIEKTTQNLVWALRDLGHDVVVIAPGRSLWRTYRVDEDGVTVLRVRSWPFPVVPNLRLSRRPGPVIESFLDEFGPEVMHVNNPFSLCKAILAYGEAHNVPVICGSHMAPEVVLFPMMRFSFLYQFLRRSLWRLVAYRYKKAAAVVSPSQTAANELVKVGVPADKSLAISNGVELNPTMPHESKPALRKKLGLPDRFTLIYVGRLNVEKRLHNAIATVAEMKDEYDIQLVMVGTGQHLPVLKRYAARHGVADRVYFPGWAPTELIKYEYLKAADVFVIPSPIETQGIVVLEAMVASKPVVALNAGALPELVRPDENGYLYPYGEIDSMAAAIEKLIQNPELIELYGKASHELVQVHDINAMPQNYLKLYRRLRERCASKSQAV